MSKCTFILTEHSDDYGYDMCHAISDNDEIILGKIMGCIIDEMSDHYANEVKIRFRDDDANGDFYDIISTIPESEHNSELVSVYHVYCLREEDKEDE